MSDKNVNTQYGAVKSLTCCCCGNGTSGRQWHNRDHGYGLCKDCVDYCARSEDEASMKSCYGIRGIHYDLPERSAIDAQIESAMQVRAQHGYAAQAVITQRYVKTNGFSLGFHFFQGELKVGDLERCDDGSWFVVLAVI